jgi:hypothetical protein
MQTFQQFSRARWLPVDHRFVVIRIVAEDVRITRLRQEPQFDRGSPAF